MTQSDFDTVLRPAMDFFARPVTVKPLKSQPPGAPAYEARGIWRSRSVDIADVEGVIVSQVVTLKIRLADFPVLPKQGDQVVVDGVTFAVSDPLRFNGRGGAHLSLKSLTAPA